MPKLHSSILISASPEAVWDVLVDPIYAPKLYEDVLYMQVSPPGKGVEGQKREAVARAGRTRIAIYGVVTVSEPPTHFTVREVPGGLFRAYREDFRLSVASVGTEVKSTFEYELSLKYLRGAMNVAVLENGIAQSLGSFLGNLKDIAELRPIEAPKRGS